MKNNYAGFFLVLFLLLNIVSQAQESVNPNQIIRLDEISNDGKREEIQRYFGYENMLCGYTTLPYDISMSTNQQGRFVDVGFPLFIILPLIFLGYYYKRNSVFFSAIVVFILYLSLCFSFSFIFDMNRVAYRPQLDNWQNFQSAGHLIPGMDFLWLIYSSAFWLAKPIVQLSESISGASDNITYPLYILFLLLGSLQILRGRFSDPIKIILFLFFNYFILWLLLSGGIVWYGFLIVPLGLGIILYYLQKTSKDKNLYMNFSRWSIKFTLFVWIFLAISSRISNINILYLSNKNYLGTSIIDGNLLPYSLGMIDAQKAREQSYKQIGTALETLNESDAIIYQVGTSFTFEIKNNTTRVFADNLLISFFHIFNKYREKETIIDVFRASNVKYIIVDLYTHTLDKTPEKSLENKFKLFLNTLYQNPKIRLLATDRIISRPDANGNQVRSNEVFGTNIVEYGSYAIYEII